MKKRAIGFEPTTSSLGSSFNVALSYDTANTYATTFRRLHESLQVDYAYTLQVFFS